MSSADQRVLVLRKGVEIGRARLTVHDPSAPRGFARAVSLLLAPGATLFVTDAPILAENMLTDMTVLSDGAPPDAATN
jgi:hypothetical protein